MAPSKHAILSPSAGARWVACPPSARLTERMPSETSPYAEEGTTAHYLCEQVVRRSLPGWSGLPPAPMEDLWENDSYTPEMKEAAKLYADFIHTVYDGFPHTPTLCVEQRVSMTRWAPECFGTCDCLLIGDGILHVIDFKYGAGVPVSPVDNIQMMLYALGAWELFNTTDDIKTVRMSIVQPRIQSEPETWETSADSSLDWAENTLRPAAKLAWEGKGELNPGEKQCRWCRAKAQCRAWKDKYGPLADFMTQTPEARDPRLLTDEEVGEWLIAAQGIADYVKCLEEYAHMADAHKATPNWSWITRADVQRTIRRMDGQMKPLPRNIQGVRFVGPDFLKTFGLPNTVNSKTAATLNAWMQQTGGTYTVPNRSVLTVQNRVIHRDDWYNKGQKW